MPSTSSGMVSSVLIPLPARSPGRYFATSCLCTSVHWASGTGAIRGFVNLTGRAPPGRSGMAWLPVRFWPAIGRAVETGRAMPTHTTSNPSSFIPRIFAPPIGPLGGREPLHYTGSRPRQCKRAIGPAIGDGSSCITRAPVPVRRAPCDGLPSPCDRACVEQGVLVEERRNRRFSALIAHPGLALRFRRSTTHAPLMHRPAIQPGLFHTASGCVRHQASHSTSSDGSSATSDQPHSCQRGRFSRSIRQNAQGISGVTRPGKATSTRICGRNGSTRLGEIFRSTPWR